MGTGKAWLSHLPRRWLQKDHAWSIDKVEYSSMLDVALRLSLVVRSRLRRVCTGNSMHPSPDQRLSRLYTMLESGPRYKHIWKGKIPAKMKFFMWLMENDAILTKDNRS